MKCFKFLIVILFFFASSAHAKLNVKSDSYYKSAVDQLLTIKSIAVLPFTDNTKGIYSKPFQSFVKNWVEENPKWALSEMQTLGRVPSLGELENNPEQVKKYARNSKADAFITGKAIRTESGLNIYLGLFIANDGLLIAKEDIKNISQADLKGLNSPFKTILNKLLKHLPYDGMILSRKDKLVTLNLSKADGIMNGQDLTVASIIQIERHPKFNFIISNEKTILGKLRVKKVDDSLTFAEIVVEKEQGSIQKDSKIVGSNFVSYGNKMMTNYDPSQSGGSNGGGNTTRGQRWRPVMPPSFGKAEVTFGLGLLKATNGDSFSENNVYPSVTFDGEIWINDFWSVHALTKQGIATLADPNGGSDFSVHTSSYEILGGYNYRMGGAYGTKIEVLAGYAQHSTKVDGASPSTFTSAKYSGIKIGGDIQTPITDGNDILAGASVFLFLKPHLKEQPNPSGRSSDSSITMFKAYGLKKFRENLYILGALNYDLYSTSFDRRITASSASQRDLTFNLGVNYFF